MCLFVSCANLLTNASSLLHRSFGYPVGQIYGQHDANPTTSCPNHISIQQQSGMRWWDKVSIFSSSAGWAVDPWDPAAVPSTPAASLHPLRRSSRPSMAQSPMIPTAADHPPGSLGSLVDPMPALDSSPGRYVPYLLLSRLRFAFTYFDCTVRLLLTYTNPA